MKLFYTILGILSILVVCLAIFYPLTRNETLAGTSLGVSTFLFGIFIGFSISDRHSRINSIRENDSSERASLEFLFTSMKAFGQPAQNKIRALIDRYIMATLDYTIWDYHKTEKEFKEIINFILSLKIATEWQTQIADDSMGLCRQISSSRKQTVSLIEERLSRLEWLVFFVMSGIVVFSFLLTGTTTMQSVVVVALSTFTIVLLLTVLYRLDNLSWKEEARIFEPYQQTFESIGLMRYYPEDLINDGRVKRHKGKRCRIGFFPRPYPDLSDKKIKIVNG